MSSKWKMVRLGDCAKIVMGQSPASSSYNSNGDGLPFYQGNADFGVINPKVRYYCTEPSKLAEINSVLMSVRAPIGALNISNAHCCIGRGLCSISGIDKTSYYKYIYYYLLFNQLYIQSLGTGSTFKAITGKVVNDLNVYLPDINKQQEIASILDKASELVEKRKVQLAELDTLSESIFYDMFGDPVTNEKGWETEYLKKLTTKIGSGSTPKGGSQSYKEEGISLIRSLNVHNGVFKYKDLAYIDDEQAEALNNVTIESNDVLLNITGASVARCCIVPNDILPGRVNQHVVIVRVIKELVDYRFFCSQLISVQYQRMLLNVGKSNGATREALTKANVEDLKIILPPLPLQQQFAERIEKIEAQKQKVKAALKESEELFQRLMQDLFKPM